MYTIPYKTKTAASLRLSTQNSQMFSLAKRNVLRFFAFLKSLIKRLRMQGGIGTEILSTAQGSQLEFELVTINCYVVNGALR